MSGTVLQTRNLTIGYKNGRSAPRVVGADINVQLKRGELVCLLGPNGAGKSTLMRTLAGMQPQLQGKISLLGEDVDDLRPNQLARRLAIVLTEQVNVGMLSAYALVALGRYPYTDWSGKLSAADHEVIRWAITAVGAKDLAERNVEELSDGERQKVMIARALVQEPQVMVLDEPTAYLDLPRRVEVMRILRSLAREQERAILLSTHDLDLALRSADRLWLMPLDGRLQVGAPEDLVLSGAFEQAFHSEGVEFDPTAGSFKLNRTHIGSVALAAEGVTAVWAQRALERAGFRVVAADADAGIRVASVGRNGRFTWQILVGRQNHCADNLYELVTTLRQLVSSF